MFTLLLHASASTPESGRGMHGFQDTRRRIHTDVQKLWGGTPAFSFPATRQKPPTNCSKPISAEGVANTHNATRIVRWDSRPNLQGVENTHGADNERQFQAQAQEAKPIDYKRTRPKEELATPRGQQDIAANTKSNRRRSETAWTPALGALLDSRSFELFQTFHAHDARKRKRT